MGTSDSIVYTTIDASYPDYAVFEWRDRDGQIALGGDTAVPGPLMPTDYGVALGPLHVATQADADLVIDGVTYPRSAPSFLEQLLPDVDVELPWDDAGNETTNNTTAAAGAAGMAAAADMDPEADDPMVGRRELLITAGTALGALAVSGSAAAADDASDPVQIAKLTVRDAGSPMELRLSSAVENVLPAAPGYDVVVDGTTEGQISRTQPTAVIPTDWLDGEEPTTVRIVRDAGILADVQALWETPTLSYSVDLADPSQAAAGSDLVLSSDRLITEPVAQVGGDKTTLNIADTSIPHRSEDTSDPVGWYATREREDGSRDLVYRVGEQAPSGTTAALDIEVGFLTEARDDLSRVI